MNAKSREKTGQYGGFAKWVQSILVRVLVFALKLLSVKAAYWLGERIGTVLYQRSKKRRAVVMRNLKVIFAAQPDLPEAKLPLEAVCLEVFQHFVANLLTGFSLSRLSAEVLSSHLEVAGLEHLKSALQEGHGAILLLAHMGPWEALTQVPKLVDAYGLSAPLGVMYRPLNNDYLDGWMHQQRESQGLRLFSRRDGFHKPVDFIRSGGVLAILSDQKMREGPQAPFFGQTVSTSPIAGLFHRRSNAPMVALSVSTIAPGKWRLRFYPVPIPAEVDRSSREALAAVCNQALEQVLCDRITDGFWLHKRF